MKENTSQKLMFNNISTKDLNKKIVLLIIFTQPLRSGRIWH